MSWRDRLQKASFGGVRFYVSTASTTFGRRGTLHEYAFSDTPYAEDTGKKAKEFTFNAYLFDNSAEEGQADYLVTLKKLMDRIESGDAGELIHPTLPKINVRPLDCVVNHEGRTGGFETLTLKFVEAGKKLSPSATNNTSKRQERAYQKLGDDVGKQYQGTVNFLDAPDYQTASAQAVNTTYLDSIENVIKQGERINARVDEAFDTLSKFRTAMPTEITDNVLMVGRVFDLYTRAGAVWDSLTSTDRFDSFLKVFETDTSTSFISSVIDTPDRRQEIANNTLIESQYKALALGQMSTASSEETYTSSTKAFERRNQLLSFYSTEIESAGVNEHHHLQRGLIDSRSAMIEDLNQKGADLPDEKAITLNSSLSAFTLGYELYGDAFRGEEISDNNKIRHPLFLPPEQELLVLTT